MLINEKVEQAKAIPKELGIENHGVATVENTMRVTATGAEYLSTPQEELLYIRS